MFPGSGWVLRPNKDGVQLEPRTFDKVYPWILCHAGKPVTEIGDTNVSAALFKAEWAISQDPTVVET